MVSDSDYKKRILDEVNRCAPSLEVLQVNERATAEIEECARQDPTGIEAAGLEDIRRVQRKLRYLYWYNTLGHYAGIIGSGDRNRSLPLRHLTDLTIVVVDDDRDFLESLELLFTSEGFRVTASAYTGDVVGLIRQVQPQVVALDLQTPHDRRAGLGVLESLRADALTALTPVLLLTADQLALRQHAADLLELGAIPVPKPFDPDHLLQLIEYATV